jgi:signal peptidase I
MEPTLLIGDRIFVSKFTYGYSKHSFPFSPPVYNSRLFNKIPKRGDLIVFKTPSDNRTDYIKRLIGLPGDTIQFVNGTIYLNKKPIIKKKLNFEYSI